MDNNYETFDQFPVKKEENKYVGILKKFPIRKKGEGVFDVIYTEVTDAADRGNFDILSSFGAYLMGIVGHGGDAEFNTESGIEFFHDQYAEDFFRDSGVNMDLLGIADEQLNSLMDLIESIRDMDSNKMKNSLESLYKFQSANIGNVLDIVSDIAIKNIPRNPEDGLVNAIILGTDSPYYDENDERQSSLHRDWIQINEAYSSLLEAFKEDSIGSDSMSSGSKRSF